jgi:hypothetical protein
MDRDLATGFFNTLRNKAALRPLPTAETDPGEF